MKGRVLKLGVALVVLAVLAVIAGVGLYLANRPVAEIGAFMNDALPDDENLERFRSYLQFLARVKLAPLLQIKVHDSDLMQQVLLASHRATGCFRGWTPEVRIEQPTDHNHEMARGT